MKLELALLAGEESKKFLASLTKQIDRLEALLGKAEGAAVKAPDADDCEDEEEDVKEDAAEDTEEDDDDFVPKKGKAKAKSFDEDEEEDDDVKEDTDEDDEDGDPVVPPKKKNGKTKAVTIDDCNDAAKALAKSIGGKPGRDKVLGLMKKHFKTQSVSELKPEQYGKFTALMESELGK